MTTILAKVETKLVTQDFASTSEMALRCARAGDRAQFDELVSRHMPKLRSVIRRLVAQPEDTEDLVQDSLLQAFEKIDTFRGEARFSTWLCTIGTRKALDYLRGRKRWRIQAQLLAEHECVSKSAKRDQFARVVSAPDHLFDVQEHIAFCFTCVARTLKPDEMTALLSRDVSGFSTNEAAQMLNVSPSVLRHKLSAARKQMQNTFAGLCVLVSKKGACWQCETLRQSHPESKRGPKIPRLNQEPNQGNAQYRRRLAIVREANIDYGRTQALHDLAWRWLAQAEEMSASADKIELTNVKGLSVDS